MDFAPQSTVVHFHVYTLRSRGALNAVSQRREFHGALIKVNDGVGCLHPWPEFGDAPIDEQLRILRDGGTSKVIERALHMAMVDGEARRRGASLFAGLEIPPSHYSWDQNRPMDEQRRKVISEGWRAIKMKGSPRFGETIRAMESLIEVARLRVDFNSCLTASQFVDFVYALPSRVLGQLEFVEDPFPYDAAHWSLMQREHGIKLALDKQLRGAGEGFDFAVIKPGRRDWRAIVDQLPKHTRIVMTSAMDHAIGQSFAAWEAAMAWRELGDRMDLCGLCTEHLFEKDAFFERLDSHGGILNVDRSGTGLGFDEVIAKIPWKRF